MKKLLITLVVLSCCFLGYAQADETTVENNTMPEKTSEAQKVETTSSEEISTEEIKQETEANLSDNEVVSDNKIDVTIINEEELRDTKDDYIIKRADTEIKPEIQVSEENTEITLKESNNAKIIYNGEKFGIISKLTDSYIVKPIIDKIYELSEDEYKIVIQNLVGYVNTDTGINFLTNYDDINLVKNYIKVKSNNKYGLIDKENNIILRPQFQRISVVNYNDTEYIYAKDNGTYRIFKNTGILVPESELYTVDKPVYKIEKKNQNGDNVLVQNLKPEFMKYSLKNAVLYERITVSANTNNQYVYEIQELENPKLIKKGKIVKTEVSNKVESLENSNIITVDNKNYILANDKDKVGLLTIDKKVILPVIFDKINIRELCPHDSKKIVLAKYNGIYSIFDLKGNTLAETTSYKVNIYKHNRIYNYVYENNRWVLKFNGKTLGYLDRIGQNFKFTQKQFHIRNLHEVNEMLISLLSVV